MREKAVGKHVWQKHNSLGEPLLQPRTSPQKMLDWFPSEQHSHLLIRLRKQDISRDGTTAPTCLRGASEAPLRFMMKPLHPPYGSAKKIKDK